MKDSNSFLKKTSLSLLSSRSERQLAEARAEMRKKSHVSDIPEYEPELGRK